MHGGQARVKISVPLVPPKPKLFFIAISIFIRRATLAQRAYCVVNPGKFPNYGLLEWGLTACDGPKGYAARGAPPAENDDGTLAPTAAGGSLPFAPDVCLPTLRRMAELYGDRLWGRYGFRDAYKPDTMPLQQKIDALNGYADRVIAKLR